MDFQKQCDEHVPIFEGLKPPSPLKKWWNRGVYRVMVFCGLLPDWSNPHNAPPAHGPEIAHKFMQMPDLLVCARCGAGRNHLIHRFEGVNNAEEKRLPQECREEEPTQELDPLI